jgi:hypothetical protein
LLFQKKARILRLKLHLCREKRQKYRLHIESSSHRVLKQPLAPGKKFGAGAKTLFTSGETFPPGAKQLFAPAKMFGAGAKTLFAPGGISRAGAKRRLAPEA